MGRSHPKQCPLDIAMMIFASKGDAVCFLLLNQHQSQGTACSLGLLACCMSNQYERVRVCCSLMHMEVQKHVQHNKALAARTTGLHRIVDAGGRAEQDDDAN